MSKPVMPAADAIDSLRLLKGETGWIAGGAPAAERELELSGDPAFELAYSDVDIFHPSMEALMTNLAILMQAGAYPLEHKDERTIRKWKRKGTQGWKTNSVRIKTHQGVEVNLVYKTIDKRPLLTGLENVSSFDFSMLGTCYDLRTWIRRDLGNYYWPQGQHGEYRLFEDRELQWLNADIGIFTGVRQADRFARYVSRGYNLDAAVTPLVQGYRITGAYYLDQDDDELQLSGNVYLELAQFIEDMDIDALLEVYQGLNPRSKVQSLAESIKQVKP